MLSLLRQAFASEDPRAFAVGEGRRVYAIGDVHGRLDLLKELLDTITRDNLERGKIDDFRLILLGDLIDRGADSAGVVQTAIDLGARLPGFACLKGNHEEIIERVFTGDYHALRLFREIGRETLMSYGIEPSLIDEGDDVDLYQAIMSRVPEAHRDFIADLPSKLVIDDYLFVHAGIRPGVPLEEQDESDLHWIRAQFLKSRAAHPHMVVHGHSITEFVDERPNRIGIDTGAYASERLSAIGLEGTERWFLST